MRNRNQCFALGQREHLSETFCYDPRTYKGEGKTDGKGGRNGGNYEE